MRYSFFEILGGNVIFGDFVGVDFGDIGVGSVFNAADNAGFEVLAFFDEFGDAFGGGFGDVGEPLCVTGLSGGIGAGAIGLFGFHG